MDGRSYNQLLAERLEKLLLELDPDDQEEAMDQVAQAAQDGGLVDCNTVPRRTAPWAFAMDLLLENPRAGDWMNCRVDFMPEPTGMTEIWEIADWLK